MKKRTWKAHRKEIENKGAADRLMKSITTGNLTKAQILHNVCVQVIRKLLE